MLPQAITFRPDDEALASAYDELPLWSALAGQLLLEQVPLRPRTHALDVGCGTGFPAIELAQRLGPGAHVTGVDPWTLALDRARRKATFWEVANVDFVACDAARLPFADASFDLLVSNLGVNNFDDPLAVVRECRRVARPGAVMALASNVRGHMDALYQDFAAIIDERDRPALERHVGHRATLDSLRALLTAGGFTPTRDAERTHVMRYASSEALFAHGFVRLGFVPGWLAIVPDERRAATFERVRTALDRRAAGHGCLALTVPLAYVEGRA